uniref:Uncharacterized protein n=1 Tax=mine drainage metagenome TaxID=410659 RepID=E6QRJ0_9ZZZZ
MTHLSQMRVESYRGGKSDDLSDTQTHFPPLKMGIKGDLLRIIQHHHTPPAPLCKEGISEVLFSTTFSDRA